MLKQMNNFMNIHNEKPEKCTNCNFMQTGVRSGFCCKACEKSKGHGHGHKCQQVDINDECW